MSLAVTAANIRHDIDPAVVAASVAHKIGMLERDRVRAKADAIESAAAYQLAVADGTSHRWTRAPEGPDYVDPMYDEWVARERDHYSTVRVIELPKTGKRFILVYGDVDDAAVTSGTGPFADLETATNWFVKNGR